MAFNHAGDRLGSKDWSGLLRVWDAATGRLLLTRAGRLLAVQPDDRLHRLRHRGQQGQAVAAGRPAVSCACSAAVTRTAWN